VDPSQLTFLAEALGTVDPGYHATALFFLGRWIDDESALVREGAVYGLEAMLGGPSHDDAHATLRLRYAKEASPGVRAAIRDALELKE